MRGFIDIGKCLAYLFGKLHAGPTNKSWPLKTNGLDWAISSPSSAYGQSSAFVIVRKEKLEALCVRYTLVADTLWSFLNQMCAVVMSLNCNIICRYKASSVAVKILQPGSTAEEYARCREKFLREIMTLSLVQHENLIKVYFFSCCF